jgi:ribonuclease D
MHKIKDRMTLAVIRALWHARDEFARSIDISAGRIFNDEVLIEIATKRPAAIDDFNKIVKRRTRVENLPTTEWFTLLHQTLTIPVQDLPELRLPSSGLPVVKLWKDRNPLGFARLSHARAAVIAKAAELEMPVENLISPDAIRQLTWQSPPENDLPTFIASTLTAAGARPWQVAAVSEILITPLAQTEPLPPPPTPEVEADSEAAPEE